MKVVVGSTNPTKIAAVKEVLELYEDFVGATVVGMKVDSTVSDQPKTLHEIITGAGERAKAAFKECRYSVGIESGFMEVPLTKTGFLELTSCVIYDGEEFHIGLSPAFECPREVMEHVQQGMDLTQACVAAGLSDDPKMGSKKGMINIVTNERVSRKDYTKQAIIMAMVHVEQIWCK